MQKSFCLCFIFFFHLKPTSGTQVLVSSDKNGIESWINLQLAGKISLKLDSNSSLLLKYSCKNCLL